MKVKTLSLAVFAVFGLAATAQAQTVPNVQSGLVGSDTIIEVGQTTTTINTNPPSLPDLPGIGNSNAGQGQLISFEALQALGDTTTDGVPNGWRWTQINPSNITPPTNPPSYGTLGYFDFVQVANESVYFGEWSDGDKSTKDASTHTVYYAGEAGDVVTTLPTQTATYNLTGINNVNGDAVNFLEGKLTANFGEDNLLEGYLENSNVIINIAALIDSSDASFAGDAFATNIGNGVIVQGDSNGHFFGTGASALAGLATFDDVSLNTAFGGSKIGD